MKVLFIAIETEAEELIDFFKQDDQFVVTVIPTDHPSMVDTLLREKPKAVIIRFLGAHSFTLLMYLRKADPTVTFFTYTFDYAFERTEASLTQKFDGYFFLQMKMEDIREVVRTTMSEV